METFWFAIVVFMLGMYVVLDGFDFGVGMVSLSVARTEAERRVVRQAIGPVWNGNEVWLIASGGVIFFAFPRAYAAGFSGFYLALILVLWLLMFRGLALELRSHVASPLWQQFWDVAFAGASFLLAFVFGTALGNLIRGVPLTDDGFFHAPFWTTWAPGPQPGIFDWFTVMMGLTAVVILIQHGAAYLAMKTEGAVHRRATRLARRSAWAAVGATLAAVVVIPVVQPMLLEHYAVRPAGYLLNVVALSGLAAVLYYRKKRLDGAAFSGSCVFILFLLASTAWGLYPNLLVASTDPALSLTVFNSAASPHGLRVGLLWFPVGLALMLAYTLYMYRSFQGKVSSSLSGDVQY